MEITGYDYVIYSTKSIFSIEEKIKEKIRQKIWPEYVVKDIEREEENKLWLFFAKDQEMEVDDIGYTLDNNGEGCFSIISGKRQVEDMVTARLDQDREIIAELRLMLYNIWSYTIILPEYIEENDFTKKIYQAVVDVLSEDVEDEDIPVQKPIQYHFRAEPIVAIYPTEKE